MPLTNISFDKAKGEAVRRGIVQDDSTDLGLPPTGLDTKYDLKAIARKQSLVQMKKDTDAAAARDAMNPARKIALTMKAQANKADPSLVQAMAQWDRENPTAGQYKHNQMKYRLQQYKAGGLGHELQGLSDFQSATNPIGLLDAYKTDRPTIAENKRQTTGQLALAQDLGERVQTQAKGIGQGVENVLQKVVPGGTNPSFDVGAVSAAAGMANPATAVSQVLQAGLQPEQAVQGLGKGYSDLWNPNATPEEKGASVLMWVGTVFGMVHGVSSLVKYAKSPGLPAAISAHTGVPVEVVKEGLADASIPTSEFEVAAAQAKARGIGGDSAVQEPSASSEVPRTGETGQDQPGGSRKVGRGKQGAKPAGAGNAKAKAVQGEVQGESQAAPKATKPAEAPVAREPWQMTREDYARQQAPVRAEKSSPEWQVEVRDRAAARDGHRNNVAQALAEGRPVPAEVLADYPDLKPPTPPKAEAPKEGFVKPHTIKKAAAETGLTPEQLKAQAEGTAEPAAIPKQKPPTPPVETPPPAEPTPTPKVAEAAKPTAATGQFMTHASSDALRDRIGAPSYTRLSTEAKTVMSDAVKQGHADPDKAIANAQKAIDGKALNAHEEAGLGVRIQELDALLKKQTAGSPKADAIKTEMGSLMEGLDRGGSTAGLSLRIRQELLGDYYSEPQLLKRAIKANSGDPLPPGVEKTLKVAARKIEASQTESVAAKEHTFDPFEAPKATRLAPEKIQSLINRINYLSGAGEKGKGVDPFAAKRPGGTKSGAADFGTPGEGTELTNLMRQVANEFSAQGANTPIKLMAKLKETFPGLSEDQIHEALNPKAKAALIAEMRARFEARSEIASLADNTRRMKHNVVKRELYRAYDALNTLGYSAKLLGHVTAPFKQGRNMFWDNPRAWFKGWAPSVKGYAKGSGAVIDQLAAAEADPLWEKMNRAGVKEILRFTKGASSAQDEMVFGTITKKIPLLAKAFEHSGAGFSAYLNEVTLEALKDSIRKNPNDPLFHRMEVNRIGTMLGRSPSKLAHSAQGASPFIFAARYNVSKIEMGIGKPLIDAWAAEGIKGGPATKRALAMYGKIAAGSATMMGIAHIMGAKVDMDPRSTNFGSVKWGDKGTPHDILDIAGDDLKGTQLFTQFLFGKVYTSGRVAGPMDGAALTDYFMHRLSPGLRALLSPFWGEYDWAGKKTGPAVALPSPPAKQKPPPKWVTEGGTPPAHPAKPKQGTPKFSWSMWLSDFLEPIGTQSARIEKTHGAHLWWLNPFAISDRSAVKQNESR